MLSQTHRALEDFDNQHDFERMAADVLNALGYLDVEPMAPGGGGDGGCDIRFREGDTPGIAFVTLENKIKEKFKLDLAKQGNAEAVIALFCNVDVTPATKLAFTKEAIAKGYRLMVFDLERLRSLLDSSLKAIRRRYLHIDDEVAAALRSQVRKLLAYPDAVPDESRPPTKLEQMLVNKLPCRLFELLMQYEETDIGEVPGIGDALKSHLKGYYRFRQAAIRFEADLMARISAVVGDRFASETVWRMYFNYSLPRFFGRSKEEIIQWGNALNYGVTWDDTERIFAVLSSEAALNTQVAELNRMLTELSEDLSAVSSG
jgi:hypothetical protein